MTGKWAVVIGLEGSEEDLEAYGPFSSPVVAQRFADRYNDAAIRPYWAAVVELWGVRAGLETIREEEEDG